MVFVGELSQVSFSGLLRNVPLGSRVVPLCRGEFVADGHQELSLTVRHLDVGSHHRLFGMGQDVGIDVGGVVDQAVADGEGGLEVGVTTYQDLRFGI